MIPVNGVMSDVLQRAVLSPIPHRRWKVCRCLLQLLAFALIPRLPFLEDYLLLLRRRTMIFRAAAVRSGINRLVAQSVQARMASTKALPSSGGGTFIPANLLNKWYNT